MNMEMVTEFACIAQIQEDLMSLNYQYRRKYLCIARKNGLSLLFLINSQSKYVVVVLITFVC